jgi:hypothetical protein
LHDLSLLLELSMQQLPSKVQLDYVPQWLFSMQPSLSLLWPQAACPTGGSPHKASTEHFLSVVEVHAY